MPAFGVYRKSLSDKVGKAAPERLPGRLAFWKRKKRNAMLAARDLYPMVERATLGHFPDVDSMLNFIRDLHIANMDADLNGVVAVIERKNTEIAGKKTGEVLKTGKDFMKMW